MATVKVGMVWLRSCSRCRGDLADGVDISGYYIHCQQCGHYLTPSEMASFLPRVRQGSARLNTGIVSREEDVRPRAGTVLLRENSKYQGGKMPRLISQAQRDRVLHLRFQKGVTNIAEIVRQVGISRQTIYRIIREREEEDKRKVTAPPTAIQVPAPKPALQAVAASPPREGANRQSEDRMYAVVRAGFSARGEDPKSRRQGLRVLIDGAEKLEFALGEQRALVSELRARIEGLEGQLQTAVQKDQELVEACHILKVAMLALFAQEIEAMHLSNSA